MTDGGTDLIKRNQQSTGGDFPALCNRVRAAANDYFQYWLVFFDKSTNRLIYVSSQSRKAADP